MRVTAPSEAGSSVGGGGAQARVPSLWLRGARFDLGFFHLSGLLALLLLVPYALLGERVILPLYSFYLICFGLPHNYLTWATIFPSRGHDVFSMQPVYTSLLVCAAISVLIPLTSGQELNDWILSFISYYSLWHAYRQHHGICKIYDSIQARRTGDSSIFADRKAMNVFFGFAAFAILVWAFTHGKFYYFLALDQKYELVHPQVPVSLFHAYLWLTGAMGVWAVKRGVYDRARHGKFIPWPQISLMLVALSTYVVPYFLIPLSAMPLAVAIGTIYHNVQYFGFVWLFERERTAEDSTELKTAPKTLGLPQRLVLQGSWVKYSGIAALYSVFVVAVYSVTPSQFGLTLIYFLALAHYIVDGYIWRRDGNKALGPFIGRLAARGI